nr:hypothetical protein CFP56_76215 [Quercus suber]
MDLTGARDRRLVAVQHWGRQRRHEAWGVVAVVSGLGIGVGRRPQRRWSTSSAAVVKCDNGEIACKGIASGFLPERHSWYTHFIVGRDFGLVCKHAKATEAAKKISCAIERFGGGKR